MPTAAIDAINAGNAAQFPVRNEVALAIRINSGGSRRLPDNSARGGKELGSQREARC